MLVALDLASRVGHIHRAMKTLELNNNVLIFIWLVSLWQANPRNAKSNRKWQFSPSYIGSNLILLLFSDSACKQEYVDLITRVADSEENIIDNEHVNSVVASVLLSLKIKRKRILVEEERVLELFTNVFEQCIELFLITAK